MNIAYIPQRRASSLCAENRGIRVDVTEVGMSTVALTEDESRVDISYQISLQTELF